VLQEEEVIKRVTSPTNKCLRADKTSEQSQLKYTTKKGEIKYLALSKSPPSINLISQSRRQQQLLCRYFLTSLLSEE
jgi:hypothetical protein